MNTNNLKYAFLRPLQITDLCTQKSLPGYVFHKCPLLAEGFLYNNLPNSRMVCLTWCSRHYFYFIMVFIRWGSASPIADSFYFLSATGFQWVIFPFIFFFNYVNFIVCSLSITYFTLIRLTIEHLNK